MPRTALQDPLRKYKFRVEVTSNLFSLVRGGFKTVNGLGVTRDSTEYREGGQDAYVHQLPGVAKSKDVTLGRGIMEDSDFWNMWASTFAEESDFRMEIIVVEQNPITGDDVRGWVVHNAWVKDFSVGDHDAVSSDVLEETVILATESIEPIAV